MILALETSCDDTCAALVGHDGTVHANVISSQEVHDRFGGVVPEIAARQHVELIDAVIAEAFARAGVGVEAVSLVAATRGPGLVGALLVGFCAAKGFAAQKPTSSAPTRPGPRVAATSDTSSTPTPARANACATTASINSR